MFPGENMAHLSYNSFVGAVTLEFGHDYDPFLESFLLSRLLVKRARASDSSENIIMG